MRRPLGALFSIAALFGALSVGTALGTKELSAQILPAAPPGDDTGPELFGIAGAIQPLANLTENPGAYSMVIPPDVMMGGEATYWASRAVGIGAMGLYSPATLEAVAGAPGRGPGTLGELEYIAGSVNLTFRIRSSGSARAIEPYFSIGGGLRVLKFYGSEVPAISATDPVATIAAGVRLPVTSSLWFRGELRDMASYYISTATNESTLQNDIGVFVGLGIRPNRN